MDDRSNEATFRQTEPDPDHSTLHCPCGSTFTWTGWSAEHDAWQKAHTPHLHTPQAYEPAPDPGSVSPSTTELLHRLWTKAVGTSDYEKPEWRDLESRIEKLVTGAATTVDMKVAEEVPECTKIGCYQCHNVKPQPVSGEARPERQPCGPKTLDVNEHGAALSVSATKEKTT